MNTAEILQFPSESGGQERRVAQLEDGFTRLANELLDAAMASGLSETELCILLAVWRKTYGYSKKMDWISNEQLEGMIGKHHTHCSTAKNLLITKKVLLQEGRKVGMNTNISEWKTKINGFCKTLAKPAKKTLAEPANEPKQKLLTTKDNITKEKKESFKPPKSPKGDDSVRTVFEFWKETHNHPTSKLDDKRRKRINARLEEGYPVDDLLAAISGALNDSWLMGKNPGNKRYDGIETILRDAAQVERLRDLSGNEHAKAIADGKYSAVTARNIQNLQNWVGSSEDTGAPF